MVQRLTLVALRIVLATVLGGTLLVQGLLVPLLAMDLDDVDAGVRVPVIVIVVLGMVAVQATVVCVWRLVTMVRDNTVFSERAYRYVDVVMGAATGTSVLMLGLAVTLAPGESVAPGIVGLICGVAVVAAGVALVVFVLRMLLAQAVAREAQALRLQAELAQVI